VRKITRSLTPVIYAYSDILDFIKGEWTMKLVGARLGELAMAVRDGTIPVRLSVAGVEAGLALDTVYRDELKYPRKK